MTSCLLYRPSDRNFRPRFYRVEIAMNLFEEVSVLREWGVSGSKGTSKIDIFGNLRHASEAADKARRSAIRRGYLRADTS
ncbi:WGR domain-containing protein [Thalassobius sp. Cn5-15]|uniref:WGR domain-containing protein n=1 Tax=Thalassobius sp. Cn5-15 TaxID=2917763 RepID=UPI001EF27743|nr:WGR domain-containing protein [Thalassobius sp. Cn5-15]MCG7494857.1 WGR domain-containing protein [Thalassobius sp. Cn5-15]